MYMPAVLQVALHQTVSDKFISMPTFHSVLKQKYYLHDMNLSQDSGNLLFLATLPKEKFSK